MQHKSNRGLNYRFTINLSSDDDMLSLKNLKENVKRQNNLIKTQNKFYDTSGRLSYVLVRYRKPLLNYPGTNKKYGWGGTVLKSQQPTEADVYVHCV
jgi:hypothetical protein